MFQNQTKRENMKEKDIFT